MSAKITTYTVNESTRLSIVLFTNELGRAKIAVGIKRLVGSKWSLDHSTCEEFYADPSEPQFETRQSSYYASDLLAKEYGGFDKTPLRFFRDNLLRG